LAKSAQFREQRFSRLHFYLNPTEPVDLFPNLFRLRLDLASTASFVPELL